MPSEASLGRSTANFARLRANIKLKRRPCCICGEPIDYTLPPIHPASYTVEHLKPKATHPHLAEDPANLDAAHRRCNSSRGNKTPPPPLGNTSRAW